MPLYLYSMKVKRIFFIVILIASVVFFGCRKSDRISPANTTSVITEGTWNVASLVEVGKYGSYQFSEYSFKFIKGGILNANRNRSSTNGSWSIGKNGSHTEITINFSSGPLDELNEHWRVIKQSATSLELEGSTRQLHLERK
jgi:hypothetical protein